MPVMPVPIDRDGARSAFERDGFLVLPGLVDPAACDALRERARALVDACDPATCVVFSTKRPVHGGTEAFLSSGDQIRGFLEEDAVDDAGNLRVAKDRAINKLGHAMHDLDPVFSAFSRAPVLAELAAALGFADPRLLQSMYIFKQPFIGGEVGLHQDATFLYTEPPRVLGLWFALEDADEGNGCLWAVPGGHRQGLRSRFRRSGAGTTMDILDPRPFDTAGEVPLPVKKGTVIALDGLVPHRSDGNRSPRSRHAYTLHLIDGAATYPEDNWLRRRPELPLRGF